MLRFVYGDLTPAKAKELKAVCMREVCICTAARLVFFNMDGYMYTMY